MTKFSDKEIRVISRLPSTKIVEWVYRIASLHGIAVHKNCWVEVVCRLSDGACLDETENLMVALGSAGIINAFQRGLLQIGYLKNTTGSLFGASR